MAKSGKLIVVEGSDGAGKGTQVEMLLNYCKSNNVKTSTFDFPQYYKTFFGKFAGRFLKGEFGDIKDVPPYIVSIPFAADRWQAKDDIQRELDLGKLVVLNRYATSNVAYQSAKLAPKDREAYQEWDFEMEYNQFQIPKEDLVIFLYVPYQISQKLIEQKAARKYLGKEAKKDIHEANGEFLKSVEDVYLKLAKKYPHWVTVDCTKNGELLSREEIHAKVVAVLKKKKFV